MFKWIFNLFDAKKVSEPKPSSLDECLALLEKQATEEDKTALIANDTAIFHHTAGRSLRNNWGLWDKHSALHQWFKDRGIWHADDMSSIILTSFKRHLLNKPIKLEEQIKYYQDYWKAYDEHMESGIFTLNSMKNSLLTSKV